MLSLCRNVQMHKELAEKHRGILAQTTDATLIEYHTQEMHKALEASLAEQKATFNDLAASLEEETGLTGIQVVLVYVEGAGKELYTATYPME